MNIVKEQVVSVNIANHVESSLKIYCSNCGKASEIMTKGADTTFKRCSRCKSDYYCSKECQIAHWPTHKDECYVMDVSRDVMRSTVTFCIEYFLNSVHFPKILSALNALIATTKKQYVYKLCYENFYFLLLDLKTKFNAKLNCTGILKRPGRVAKLGYYIDDRSIKTERQIVFSIDIPGKKAPFQVLVRKTVEELNEYVKPFALETDEINYRFITPHFVDVVYNLVEDQEHCVERLKAVGIPAFWVNLAIRDYEREVVFLRMYGPRIEYVIELHRFNFGKKRKFYTVLKFVKKWPKKAKHADNLAIYRRKGVAYSDEYPEFEYQFLIRD